MTGRLLWATCILGVLALPAEAGPWTLGEGKLRLSLTGSAWHATERFVGSGAQTQGTDGALASPGTRVPLGTDTDGAVLDYQQVALHITYGIIDPLEVHVYVPFTRIAFEDDANDEGFETLGMGDPILGINYQVLQPLGFGFDLKIPVASVPRTATELPLSEGQFDLSFWQRSGTSWAGERWSLWIELNLGYRLRLPFREDLAPEDGGRRVFKPGNEFVLQAGAGFRPFLSWMAITLNIDALFGADGEDRSDPNGLVLQTPRREILELQPGLLFEPGWGLGIHLVGGFAVYGRNYPSGPRAFLSISRTFELYEPSS